MTTPERKPCGTCGTEFTVTAAGGMRSHTTDNPDFQADPETRKCKGAGKPPAGPAGVALAEDMEGGQPQCRLCKHPVALTGNGRSRSHLTPEATPRPCPGGSDFPLGTYPEIVGTTDGQVATLAFDCEHRDVGACQDCYAAEDDERFLKSLKDVGFGAFAQKVRDVRAKGARADHDHEPGTDDYGATACIICGTVLEERPTAPWGVQPDDVTQPTMADQLRDVSEGGGVAVHCFFNCGHVVRNSSPEKAHDDMEQHYREGHPGASAMDGDTRTEAERFMGAGVPEQPTARDRADLPDGFDPRCEQCNTDT
ncbi:hypothetical protein, partial [Streptomyces sp. NPDC001781]